MNEAGAVIERVATEPDNQASPPPKVAYVMSRFPSLTETFVLYEILAVERQGCPVEVYPLLRGDRGGAVADGASIWQKGMALLKRKHGPVLMHPEAAPLVARAHYQPFFSWPILLAQLHFLLRNPGAYFGALAALVRNAWGSVNFLVGGLAIFPKAVYFARRMQRDGVTHVHAHFANHPTTTAFIIHRLTGIPYSFTAHGSDIHRDKRMLPEKVAEAAFVVPISQYNKEVLSESSRRRYDDKLEIIHCGVDTQVFRHRAMSNGHHRAAGPLSILCIGKMHEVKGQTHLIEACRLLRERGVAFQCRFIGDGPDQAALTEQIAAADLADCVHLLGLKTRAQVVELLEQADVVAAPSVPSRSGRREGIPVVLMEAMASGIAVVASRLSGIPELVLGEKTGLLVPPGDAEQLAGALQRLAADPELRRRLGSAGRDRVLDEFDLDKNATLLIERFTAGAL